MDDFTYYKEQLKKYNKILVKGNPSHSSFVNGFSILSTTGEVELTELSWTDIIQYLEKLKTPMSELDFYRLLRQYLPRNNQVTEDLHKEVTSRLNSLETKEEQYRWSELTKLVEDTARAFELQHDDVVDITIDFNMSKITITNNNNL